VASFVHPQKVPNMANAEAVCNGMTVNSGVNYIGLVLNEKDLDKALDTRLNTIQSAVYVTETFTNKNSGFSIESAMKNFEKNYVFFICFHFQKLTLLSSIN